MQDNRTQEVGLLRIEKRKGYFYKPIYTPLIGSASYANRPIRSNTRNFLASNYELSKLVSKHFQDHAGELNEGNITLLNNVCISCLLGNKCKISMVMRY